MTQLDKALPDKDGLYKVEITASGEWVTLASMTRASVEKLCDYAIKLSDKDNEALL